MIAIKPLLIFLMGCALTAVLTWSSYRINLDNVRSAERQIITDLTSQLQINLDITIGEVFMPTLIGIQRGEISPESFKTLTDSILIDSPTTTSVGWVPVVEPGGREAFVANSSLLYPNENFTISFIGDFGEILPRPVDNTTMWPLLHANPVLNVDFRGVDIHYGLWENAIDLMVKENRTVISDLLDLTELHSNEEGILTNQMSIYQLLHPVFDIKTYKLIGTFNRLFFPSRLVTASLKGSSIYNINTYQISLFRINDSNIKEVIYVQTNAGKLITAGKNVYTEEREINKNIFIVELISESGPRFETYGIILLVSFFSAISIGIMYVIQMNTSKKYKVLSEKYKKATDMKSTFLAEMSHELRTPLNGIIGTIDILTSMSLNLNIGEYLRDIKSCGDILITLIAGILDFSKIEAGKVDLEIAPMNMGLLIKDTTRILVHSFNGSKDVDVILNTTSIPDCKVLGDENRFRQIFMNLVSNSLKFTNTGSIKINVCSKELDSGTNGTYLKEKCEKTLRVSISIDDTGTGIAEDRIQDLFQPFSQVSGTTSFGGTGLGLVITKTLCETMNGSISCSSVYTKGSCFSCDVLLGIPSTFSVYDDCQKWSLLKDTNKEVSGIETALERIDDQEVLIVDDVLVNRKVIGGLLGLHGVNYHMAPDGVKAIELCRKNKYKLILMDYYMPGMTGIEVAMTIRGDRSNLNKDTVIIGLTASHTPETLESIMKSGMDGYELKPIRKYIIDDLYHKYLEIPREDRILTV